MKTVSQLHLFLLILVQNIEVSLSKKRNKQKKKKTSGLPGAKGNLRTSNRLTREKRPDELSRLTASPQRKVIMILKPVQSLLRNPVEYGRPRRRP